MEKLVVGLIILALGVANLRVAAWFDPDESLYRERRHKVFKRNAYIFGFVGVLTSVVGVVSLL